MPDENNAYLLDFVIVVTHGDKSARTQKFEPHASMSRKTTT